MASFVSIYGAGDAVTLTVRGELDAQTVSEHQETLCAAVEVFEDVTMDLIDVSLLCAAGCTLLVELADRVRRAGGQFRLRVAPGSLPARVLALTGVGSALDPRWASADDRVLKRPLLRAVPGVRSDAAVSPPARPMFRVRIVGRADGW